MKILRRIFNKDEKVGESILKKIDSSTFIICKDTTDYLIEVDNFKVRVTKSYGFDMTSGSTWTNYHVMIEGIKIKVSNHTSRKIFDLVESIHLEEEFLLKLKAEEEKRFLYKDIKIHFND